MRLVGLGGALALALALAGCAARGPEVPGAPAAPQAAADPAACQAEADGVTRARMDYIATEDGALAMMLGAGVQASVLVCGSGEQGCTLDHDSIRKADLERTWQRAYAACMGMSAP